MKKTCEMCARPFECKDGRRKYCDDCRKARKKMFDYNAVRKARDAARQRRKDIEQQNADLIRENYALREQVEELKNRNRILCARLKEFPTIEAEPVRHGHWEEIPGMNNTVFCSECLAAANKELAMKYKGCPFCLARIDGVDER